MNKLTLIRNNQGTIAKKIFSGLIIFLLSLFLMGATQCHTTNDVVLPEGPVSTELGKTKDEQIKGLVEQVKKEQEARMLEKEQGSLAAANLDGILFAVDHIEPGLPRNAIEEEARLGKARLPESNPQEVIKAKDRVIAILQNEVAKAKELYGKAFNEAAQAKALIAEKDKIISIKDKEISDRTLKIADLEAEKVKESELHKKDMQDRLDAKDKELADYKKEQDDKDRKWWVNAIRISGLVCILAGAVLIAIFKLIPEGGIFIAVGLLIGLVSVGFDKLTSAAWFPYAAGVVALVVLGGSAFAIYRMWKTQTLHTKTTAALQDLKDEAETLGHDTWEKVSDHLKYRLGDKNSFWGKSQVKSAINLGLVAPANKDLVDTTTLKP